MIYDRFGLRCMLSCWCCSLLAFLAAVASEGTCVDQDQLFDEVSAREFGHAMACTEVMSSDTGLCHHSVLRDLCCWTCVLLHRKRLKPHLEALPVLYSMRQAEIPIVGFGVAYGGDQAFDAVSLALATGLRHLDLVAATSLSHTARAIVASGLRRDELFLSTKVYRSEQGFEDALESLQRQLAELGQDYFDLCLVHSPFVDKPGVVTKLAQAVERAGTWRALERAMLSGMCREIGVSNYDVADLEELSEYSRYPPALNQLEVTPYRPRHSVLQYCRERGILTSGWGTGQAVGDALVRDLAKQEGSTPRQLLYRWHHEQQIIVLTATLHPWHLIENLGFLDAENSQMTRSRLGTLSRGPARVPERPPGEALASKMASGTSYIEDIVRSLQRFFSGCAAKNHAETLGDGLPQLAVNYSAWLSDWAPRGIPVVVEGLSSTSFDASEWAAMLDGVRSHGSPRNNITFADALGAVQRNPDEGTYEFDLRSKMAALWEKLPFFAQMRSPLSFAQLELVASIVGDGPARWSDWRQLIDLSANFVAAFLFVAAEGTKTSLHYDLVPNHWVVQLRGARKIQLLPPSLLHRVPFDVECPQENCGARRVRRPWAVEHLTPVTMELLPGQALSLPPAWIHEIEHSADSLGVVLHEHTPCSVLSTWLCKVLGQKHGICIDDPVLLAENDPKRWLALLLDVATSAIADEVPSAPPSNPVVRPESVVPKESDAASPPRATTASAPSFVTCEGVEFSPLWQELKEDLVRVASTPFAFRETVTSDSALRGRARSAIEECANAAQAFSIAWNVVYWKLKRGAGERHLLILEALSDLDSYAAELVRPWLVFLEGSDGGRSPPGEKRSAFCLGGCVAALWVESLAGGDTRLLRLAQNLLGVVPGWDTEHPYFWGSPFDLVLGSWSGWERPTVDEVCDFSASAGGTAQALAEVRYSGGAVELLHRLQPCDPLRDRCFGRTAPGALGGLLAEPRRTIRVTILGIHAETGNAFTKLLSAVLPEAFSSESRAAPRLEFNLAGSFDGCGTLLGVAGVSTPGNLGKPCATDPVKDYMRSWEEGRWQDAGSPTEEADRLNGALAAVSLVDKGDLMLCVDQVVFCWMLRRRASHAVRTPMVLHLGHQLLQDVPMSWRDEVLFEAAQWVSASSKCAAERRAALAAGARPSVSSVCDVFSTFSSHFVVQVFWQGGVIIPWVEFPQAVFWSNVVHTPPPETRPSLLVLKADFWTLAAGAVFSVALQHLFTPAVRIRWSGPFLRNTKAMKLAHGLPWISWEEMAAHTAALVIPGELYCKDATGDAYAMGLPILAPSAAWMRRVLPEMWRSWGILHTEFQHSAPACPATWCLNSLRFRGEIGEWPHGPPWINVDKDPFAKIDYWWTLADTMRYPQILHFSSLAELARQFAVARSDGDGIGTLMRRFYVDTIVGNAMGFYRQLVQLVL